MNTNNKKALFLTLLNRLETCKAIKAVQAMAAPTAALIDAVALNIAAAVTDPEPDSYRATVFPLVPAGMQSTAEDAALLLFSRVINQPVSTAAQPFEAALQDHRAGQGRRRDTFAVFVAGGVPEAVLPGYDSDSADFETLTRTMLWDIIGSAAGEHARDTYVRVRSEDGYAMRGHSREWKEHVISQNQVLLDIQAFGLERKQAVRMLPDLRTVDSRRMRPGSLDEFVEIGNETALNTYKPGVVQPSPGSYDNVDALLLNLAGGDVHGREYLKDWLANMIQPLLTEQRAQQNRTALVLVGQHGSGKDTLRRILTLIMGELNVKMLGNKTLQSRFGDAYKDKLLLVFNEIEAREDDAHHWLKLLITEETFPLEPKGRPERTYPNYANVMIFSNADVPVIIEDTDRRYSVFFSTVLSKDVSSAVYADLGGARAEVAAFLHHLIGRKVTYQPGMIFETRKKKALGAAALTSEKKFIEELKSLGFASLERAWKEATPPFEDQRSARVNCGSHGWVTSEGLYATYKHFATVHGYNRPKGENALADAIRTAFPHAEKHRIKVAGRLRMAWRGLPDEPVDDYCDEMPEDGTADLLPDAIDIEEWFVQHAATARN